MNALQRVGFIGSYPPRRCGIATFTYELHRAVSTTCPGLETSVVAMTDRGRAYDYPSRVHFEIREETVEDYARAAEFLNAARLDVVSLQHEYGIFGGEAGGSIIELLSRLEVPVVTTLHTVLLEPSPLQRDVMRRITEISAKIVVMSARGRDFLRSVHDIPDRKIDVIPHGIPDYPFLQTHQVKEKLGFGGKMVILTFGLLSPNKGIEIVIDAMPGIIRSCPQAVYVVLGATHPTLVRHQGEVYRDSLMARARELGVEDNVVFFNQFVEQSTLLEFISMCDVYVTPYLNEAQMTSGTLAYSFGLGKAVISTPYWHAKELLSDGRGILVPFGDTNAMRTQIVELLTDDVRRHSIRKRAYAASRSMTWAQAGSRYVAVLETARDSVRPGRSPPVDPIVPRSKNHAIPDIRIAHFLSLCDSTGMLQHAVHSVPDRAHGYCVDDNARALLFASALSSVGDVRVPDPLTARFAAFVQHAWNPDVRRFRNFMSYDRRWLEEQGSEDCHGRTLWALAECGRGDADPSRRRWATSLFEIALPAAEKFTSPRAWAFALLGLDTYCTLAAGDSSAKRMRVLLADRLVALLIAMKDKDWPWFEDVLAYDNARLSQALIQTGQTTHTPSYIEAGLRSLGWLMSLQTTASGYFRPIGTDSFGRPRQEPAAFDQQPVEAAAAVSACLAAWRVDSRTEWVAGAMSAFGWFLGDNDLRTTLIDDGTGSCSDGLHPNRINENKGAESALSYLLALVDIRKFERTAAAHGTKAASELVRSTEKLAIPLYMTQGADRVSILLCESPDYVSATGFGQGRCETLQTGDGTTGSQPDRQGTGQSYRRQGSSPRARRSRATTE
jgi:glycosyltransferase involved in cell wall biosynthesis